MRAAALVLAIALVACGGGPGELLEMAQFEELQRNTSHARELYQEIVTKYPDSPEAATAKERLKALEATP
jgi:TolA-binding protein